MNEEKEPTLAELVAGWLNDTRHGSHVLRPPGRYGKLYDATVLQHKIWMRRAHRFTLDSGFVELATEAANTTPAKILNRVQYATLPYETTWIEFNLIDKIATSISLGTLDTTGQDLTMPHEKDLMGYLLIRVNKTDSLVIPFIYPYDHRDSPMGPNMVSVWFTTNHLQVMKTIHGYTPVIVPARNSTMDDDQNHAILSEGAQAGAASLWGYIKQAPEPGTKLSYNAMPFATSALIRHAYPLVSPFYKPLIDMAESGRGGDPDGFKFGSAAKGELREFAGHMRWLVTVLAMLNEVPIQTRELKRDPGYRPNFRHRRPEIDHHVVTLAIPRTKPIQQIERHLRETGQQRRAHDVRSHWRTYLTERPCGREDHVWEYDQEHGYRLCGNCMTFSRLIHEHVRGNSELGWVKKEYKVVKGDDDDDKPDHPSPQ